MDLAPWLAGVLIGALIGGLVALVALVALRRDEDGVSVHELRRELDDYRGDVAAHYAETAKRVDALTQAYKSVYDHLEEGAFRLVGEEELRRRIEDTSGEPVTLEGIGRRALEPGEHGPREGDAAEREPAPSEAASSERVPPAPDSEPDERRSAATTSTDGSA